MNNVIPFPKPSVPPIRCIERDCDRAFGEIEELLANVLQLKELMSACSKTSGASIPTKIRNQPEPV